MRFRVRHLTRYQYRGPVILAAQTFRLSPRDDGTQQVLSRTLAIDPLPGRVTVGSDPFGNVVHIAWFNHPTDHLVVESGFEVETLRADPFDFLPDPPWNHVPTMYPDAIASALAPFRARRRPRADDNVAKFAAEALADSDGTPMGFGLALIRRLRSDFDAQVREEGDAQAPEVTLQLRAGACRDLAVLFIDAARALGLAARFVSGYRRGDPHRRDRHLHAWSELYVEGGGWRGFDPVEGLAVGDDHVALACAPEQYSTMPVEGRFTGPAGSELTYQLEIHAG